MPDRANKQSVADPGNMVVVVVVGGGGGGVQAGGMGERCKLHVEVCELFLKSHKISRLFMIN